MRAQHPLSQDEVARRLRLLEERAQKLGWSIQYHMENDAFEEEIRQLELEMLKQEERVARLRKQFGGQVPTWVIERIQFPLDEEWFACLEASLRLDAGWRTQLEARKRAMHPSCYDRLPVLPPLIDEQTLVPILQAYDHIEKEWLNRLCKLLFSISKPKSLNT